MITEVYPTDSQATLQAAVDSGGTVHFNPGTYNLTAPLLVTSAVELVGDEPVAHAVDPDHRTGREWPCKLVGGGAHPVHTFARSAVFVECLAGEDVTIKNLELDSTSLGTSGQRPTIFSVGSNFVRQWFSPSVNLPQNWLDGANLSIESCRLLSQRFCIWVSQCGNPDVSVLSSEITAVGDDPIRVSFGRYGRVVIDGNDVLAKQNAGAQQTIEFFDIYGVDGTSEAVLTVSNNVLDIGVTAASVAGLNIAARLELYNNVLRVTSGTAILWGSTNDAGGFISGNEFINGHIVLGGAGKVFDLGHHGPDGVSGASNLVIEDNVFSGVHSTLVYMGEYGFGKNTAKDNIFRRNDSENAHPSDALIVLSRDASGNIFQNNKWGAPQPSLAFGAGIYCEGDGNTFTNEEFDGFPGWTLESDGSYSGLGAILLLGDENLVVALKHAGPPYGMDVCKQVASEGQNYIPGFQGCGNPADLLQQLKDKLASLPAPVVEPPDFS